MDGYRGVLEFQPYATSLPNGTANTRGLASPHKVSGFKAGRAETRIFAVGDHTRVWAASSEIPYAAEQGNFSKEQGSRTREQGI